MIGVFSPPSFLPSMIVSVGVSLLGGRYAYYATISYSALAIAYFLVREYNIFKDHHVVTSFTLISLYICRCSRYVCPSSLM